MMSAVDSAAVSVWLQYLRRFVPPKGVLLVGAGSGTGSWIKLLAEWAQTRVTLVEADENLFRHLVRCHHDRADWRLRNEVVAAREAAVSFFEAVSPLESGLLRPESLASLWPNAKTRAEHEREAVTLAKLLDKESSPHNWLLIDCLSALSILLGGHDCLKSIDVIAARVLLDPDVLPGSQSDQEAVTAFLEAQGFRHVTTHAGRHPSIGHALYLRDYPADLDQLAKALAAAQASQAELAQRLAGSQANAEQLSKEKEELRQLCEQHARLTEEHAEQVLQATRARIEAEHKAEEVRSAAAIAQQRAKELQVSLNEVTAREQLLEDSLARLEGQLALIKEVLELREGVL